MISRRKRFISGEPAHDHHHRSKITNRYMGHVQIALGSIFGSFGLVAAGIHNELDSPVHDLRGRAEYTDDARQKLRLRLAAGTLMIVGASGVYLLEKLVPINQIGVVTPLVFGAETAVNGYNTYSHASSNLGTHDTQNGLRHNVVDTVASFVAFTLSFASLARGYEGTVPEAIIGFGHVGAMVALGSISIAGATKEFITTKDRKSGTAV